jgi:ethanolamine utilization protein EutN
MKVGRVTGRVVSTRKDPLYEGKKILIVQPVSPEGKDTGKPVVALDSAGAGWKETVLFVTAKEAAWPFLPDHLPSDCTIVGIVDDINLPKKVGR